jgi:glycosyltransferase involved in cell wall biosynthesis
VGGVSAPVRYLDAATQRRKVAIAVDHLRLALATPTRYAATLSTVLRGRSIDAAYTASSRLDCFHQAVHLARRLRRVDNSVRHLHAHFAHDPTLIALLTHQLTGISFSFTAHARDLYQIPRQALVDRVAAASEVITCCGANLSYLKEVIPRDQHGKLHLIYHGVNLARFSPSTEKVLSSDAVPVLLSVGRLVEKKGFPDLLRACAILAQTGRPFRCVIYGDGPLRPQLSAQVSALGLVDTVILAGERRQHELIPIFQNASMFVLAPYVTLDGDRDGAPNVLAEAMACGLPVVSTRVAGIPELVWHEQNGLLCEPRDADDLARQLGRLLDDAALRTRLGGAARATVSADFNARDAAARIAAIFEGIVTADDPRR